MKRIHQVQKFNVFTSLAKLEKDNTKNSKNLLLSDTSFCVKDNFCTSGLETTCGSK